jgi:hypothetical protein
VARFPDFIKKQPCPWASKRFQELDEKIREAFLARELQIVKIETDDPNEARDLFVRLQAGMPLNSQEKRDAWPGQFTEFVLRLGGKVGLAKYPGHDFFNQLMQARRTKDRGKFRQLAAQIAMLFFTHREKGAFCDINSAAIDDYYYENLGFDADASGAKRLYEVLDKLTRLLGDRKRPKIIGHEAIHLVLFVDSILDDYTRSWETQFAAAFDQFRKDLGEARLTRYEANPYWLRYGVGTRVNSDRHEVIQRRHEFFAEKMRTALDLQMKDPQRAFGLLERELIYYRQRKRCAVCTAEVVWEDAEIHHVKEHSVGGKTELENGALVHHDCHPKGGAVAEFAKKWGKQGGANVSAGPSRDELAAAAEDDDENNES